MEVAGIETDSQYSKTQATFQGLEFSTEALINILTKISGPDRQMLTSIVQRWSSLSCELKQAILRVVELSPK